MTKRINKTDCEDCQLDGLSSMSQPTQMWNHVEDLSQWPENTFNKVIIIGYLGIRTKG